MFGQSYVVLGQEFGDLPDIAALPACGIHGGVAGGKIHGIILKITNAGTRPFGLIIDLDILVGPAELFKPGRVDRGRKAGTGAGQADFFGRGRRRGQQHSCHQDS